MAAGLGESILASAVAQLERRFEAEVARLEGHGAPAAAVGAAALDAGPEPDLVGAETVAMTNL